MKRRATHAGGNLHVDVHGLADVEGSRDERSEEGAKEELAVHPRHGRQACLDVGRQARRMPPLQVADAVQRNAGDEEVEGEQPDVEHPGVSEAVHHA